MRSTRRPHATPSATRNLERSLRTFGEWLFRYRFRIVADLAVVALVLSLPLGLRAAPILAAREVASAPASDLLAVDDIQRPRARAVARGATITAAGGPRTSIAEDVKPIVQYTLGPDDTLQSLANFYEVSPEAIAFSNGISDPDLGQQAGRTIMIPPGEGALYTVAEGDTVESVAERFEVDPKAIMDYNRLYFEPEHFAPAQLVFVPGATVPGLVYAAAAPTGQVQAPSVLSRPQSAVAAPTGQLAWPVAGRITQYFWAFHTGVDLAAPYGSGLAASAAGTVIRTGWVPVGGLSVQIQHPDGLVTGYYHMGAVFVAPGQTVEQGHIIGSIGMTGVTTGPHVHWEVRRNGAYVNPLAYAGR